MDLKIWCIGCSICTARYCSSERRLRRGCMCKEKSRCPEKTEKSRRVGVRAELGTGHQSFYTPCHSSTWLDSSWNKLPWPERNDGQWGAWVERMVAAAKGHEKREARVWALECFKGWRRGCRSRKQPVYGWPQTATRPKASAGGRGTR